MKARKVFETIHFERGKGAKASMGIGIVDRMPEVIFQAALDSDYVISATRGNMPEPQPLSEISTHGSKLIMRFYSPPIMNWKTDTRPSKLRAAEDIMKDAGLEGLFKYFSYSHSSTTSVGFILKDGEFKDAQYDPEDYGLVGN